MTDQELIQQDHKYSSVIDG